ncbi:MAG: hypothetical protein F2701_05895, partial [Actinobacteria bacterium]|nr:hypothetical protein [Actinomycetota bacterium]
MRMAPIKLVQNRLLVWPLAVALAIGIGLVNASNYPAIASTKLVAGEQVELSVLVYNIEYSGDASTDRVIREIDADIVGVLESYNRLPEIARKTGYPYYNVGLQLLSKFPILEPSGA